MRFGKWIVIAVLTTGCAAKNAALITPQLPAHNITSSNTPTIAGAAGFPRLANQIQVCCTDGSTRQLLDRLAFWDVGIIDAEIVRALPEYLGPDGTIRRVNPSSILLAYFSAGDISVSRRSPLTMEFNQGIKESWYLKDVNGKKVPLFQLRSGDWTLAQNPTTNIKRYLTEFLNQNVLQSGAVNGIFFDWMNPKISWLNHRKPRPSGRIDIDQDGKAEKDKKLDRLWSGGLMQMLALSRKTFPKNSLIVGNAGWNSDPVFTENLNGAMIERFLDGEKSNHKKFGWGAVMKTYATYENNAELPHLFIIMANDDREKSFAKMRFSLASTLMFGGYFCFTNENGPYGTARWYDEYSVDLASGKAIQKLEYKGYLGSPISEAYDALKPPEYLKDRLRSGPGKTESRVWRRDFEHGIVLVNPSEEKRRIVLNGTFRKIQGTVDRKFNDGSRVDVIELGAREGVILLR